MFFFFNIISPWKAFLLNSVPSAISPALYVAISFALNEISNLVRMPQTSPKYMLMLNVTLNVYTF